MAAALGLSRTQFLARHTERAEISGPSVRRGRQLRIDAQTGHCSLLSASGKCTVFHARPAGCRTYPFWPSNLVSRYEWAREATLCEGIQQPFSSAASDAHVDPSTIERELIIEELRLEGVLHEEGWDHGEASANLSLLPELGDLSTDSDAGEPRHVLHHEGGLVVLETPQEDGSALRSLHFEDSLGQAQSEVFLRGAFEHSRLAFAVHRACRALLRALGFELSLATGVAVLGCGAGALPMSLASDPSLALGHVDAVELQPEVLALGRRFFGLSDERLCTHLGDAADFVKKHSAAAVIVDIAASHSPRPGLGGLLTPDRDPWLSQPFVGDALAMVRASGAVAWNLRVAASESEPGQELRDLGRFVAGVRPDVSTWALGPMACDLGAQWLLVALVGDLAAWRGEARLLEALADEGLGEARCFALHG